MKVGLSYIFPSEGEIVPYEGNVDDAKGEKLTAILSMKL